MTLAHLVASGLGVGYAPVAPGTVASVVALGLGAAMLLVSPLLLAAAAVAATLIGFWVVRHAEIKGDPGWVVIDEFAGQWITLLGVGHLAPLELAIAFLLFRVLDIAKPGPIGWADRQKGPMGIMADDVIAGLIGAALMVLGRAALAGVTG